MPTELEDFDLDEMDELEDDDDNEQEEKPPVPPSDRVAVKRSDAQRMRAAVKENKRLKAELDKSRREQAIKDAGIKLDTPMGRFFAEKYDGEADAEKIRKAAIEAGAPLNEAASETPASAGEQQATDERQRLASGGVPDDGSGAPTPDPKEEALKVGRQVLDAGGSEEDAIAASIVSQAQAALKGDERAIIKPAWEQ